MPGLWQYSLMPVVDPDGKPYIGALAYFFEAGTTTPRNTYADFGLGVERTWPVEADGFGRFPVTYLDDGFYRLRITTAGGSQLFDVDQILVVGPSTGEGGGGGESVDQDGLLRTGDVIWAYATSVRSGFVRLNGRSIGGSGSGATERANADTQPLYEHLWNVDDELQVVGGRGSTAVDDFNAGKAIFLPDARRKGLFGLAGMGNDGLSFPGALFDQGNGTTLGSFGGELRHVLTQGELPSATVTGATETEPDHIHGLGDGTTQGGTGHRRVTGSGSNTNTSPAGAHNHDFESDPIGDDDPHNNMPPFILGTFYIRL